MTKWLTIGAIRICVVNANENYDEKKRKEAV